MIQLFKYLSLLLVFALIACKPEKKETKTEVKTPEVPAYLPMKTISLDDLSAFQKADKTWKLVNWITSEYQTANSLKTTEGKGILISEASGEGLNTKMEHADLELVFETLIPKAAQGSILFQNRYKLQLADSWEDKETNAQSCGTVSSKWDKAQAPRANANKAAGLWQKFHILFRAPQFDKTGKKIKNARFESIYQNGVLIHENVEFVGKAEEEIAFAPLLFKNEAGKIAFRNIQYKKYGSQTLKLNKLTYQAFAGKWDKIPDFKKLKPSREGKTDSIASFDDLAGIGDHYALQFKGELEVPADGQYLLETIIDDGGDLILDGKLVIRNEGEPGEGIGRSTLNLSKGLHQIELTFYEEVWASTFSIYYEGPEMEKQVLASQDILAQRKKNEKTNPIILNPQAKGSPEVIRSFVNYQTEKRTHTISVGSPAGAHFSYDLKEGSWLNAWRGGFADVSGMWHDRGESQLLSPLSAVTELSAGIPLGELKDEKSPWVAANALDFKYKAYQMDEQDFPTFIYTYKDIKLADKILADQNGKLLTRKVLIDSDKAQTNYWYKIATAQKIVRLENGWYSIDQKYYLKVNNQAKEVVRTVNNQAELLIPILQSGKTTEVNYSILF
jgi:hypothetical protein